MLEHRKVARVLFDEGHAEAWTIRPDVAASMQPAHPGDASYVAAAQALAARDFTVASHHGSPLTCDVLAHADVLVIAHPSDPQWERTVPGGTPALGPEEIDAIEEWVQAGGGLVLLGETEQDKYGNNLNELAGRFGLRVGPRHRAGLRARRRRAVLDRRRPRARPAAAWAPTCSARVDAATFYRAGVLEVSREARVLARTHPSASTPRAPLAAAVACGAGRVAVLADSDLFGDDCLELHGHRELWLNLVYWAAGASFGHDAPAARSAAAADPHWPVLRDEVEALRALPARRRLGRPRGPRPRRCSTRTSRPSPTPWPAWPATSPTTPSTSGRSAPTSQAWAAGGYEIPDFSAALDAFRPELHRARRHRAPRASSRCTSRTARATRSSRR